MKRCYLLPVMIALVLTQAQAKVPIPEPAPHRSTANPQQISTPSVETTTEPRARTVEDALELVEKRLNSTPHLTANFVQVTGDGRRSEGKLFVDRPGKFLFRYTNPPTLEVVANGRVVAIRDQKLKTQDLYPINETPLRFLSRPKISFDRDTKVVGVTQDDKLIQIRIEESNTLGGKSRLMLMFDNTTRDLVQWTVIDPQGFETNVALTEINTSSKPEGRLFVIDETRTIQGGN